MAELQKCPFCGGEAEVVKVHSGVAMFPYTVVCKSDECSASVGVFKETIEKAIEAWNNRPTEAEIRAMAIDEFAEKFVFQAVCQGCSGCCNCYELGRQKQCGEYQRYMEIAEQLKGE